MSYNFIYVENIIAWSISCIAYDWPLPCRKDPIKFSAIPRPCLVQWNRLLKIFLMPIQSKAFSGPVKSTPKDFSDANSVKEDKTSSGPAKSIPKDFADADPVEVIQRPCLVQLNRFLKIFLMSIHPKATRTPLVQSNWFLKILLMPIQLKLFQDPVWSS